MIDMLHKDILPGPSVTCCEKEIMGAIKTFDSVSGVNEG